jgi:predicted PurR-regulated permease PerM
MMLNEILILAGIVMMAYSIIISIYVKDKIDSRRLRRYWKVIIILLVFFMFGYIGYVYNLVSPDLGIVFDDRLVSIVFFFGAAFVVMVIRIIDSLLSSSSRYQDRLKDLNRSLKETAGKLDLKKREIESKEIELRKKNAELESTLEDFYTFRLSMERGSKQGKVRKENQSMKKKLNNLRNE